MKTREETMTSGAIDGYHNFLGDDSEYKDWFNVIGRSRDSECIEESNFDAALKELGGEGENVRVERYGHWAVGWIEEVYVRPNTPEAAKAEAIHKKLEDYPVLDDDDFSERETEAANEQWRDCYDNDDRIRYMREHPEQFEFRSFSDMLGCARGKYFSGWSSELLG